MMSEPGSTTLLNLPPWLRALEEAWSPQKSIDERMRFVIATARQNVERQSGGPFAAAVFERDSGRLIALGTNLVTSHNNAILHAEIVAIMLAQQRLENFDLGASGLPAHELVSSSEPCTMCMGATNWSGVKRLVFGATVADAEAVGFDEGPACHNWKQDFAARGIEVTGGIERDKAAAVLQLYKKQGGPIYNARADQS